MAAAGPAATASKIARFGYQAFGNMTLSAVNYTIQGAIKGETMSLLGLGSSLLYGIIGVGFGMSTSTVAATVRNIVIGSNLQLSEGLLGELLEVFR